MEITKERPILMNTESVKGIQDNRKTHTRRLNGLKLVNNSPDDYDLRKLLELDDGLYAYFSNPINSYFHLKCPYGKVGDHLWVRETWFSFPTYDNLKPSKIPHTESLESMHENDIDYLASPIPYYNRGKKRPSIFMRRWASRIDLEITDIRVERVQDITRDDAISEGIPQTWGGFRGNIPIWALKLAEENSYYYDNRSSVENFALLWDSINAKRGYEWEVNPWVWVVVFKVIKKYWGERDGISGAYLRIKGGCR